MDNKMLEMTCLLPHEMVEIEMKVLEEELKTTQSTITQSTKGIDLPTGGTLYVKVINARDIKIPFNDLASMSPRNKAPSSTCYISSSLSRPKIIRGPKGVLKNFKTPAFDATNDNDTFNINFESSSFKMQYIKSTEFNLNLSLYSQSEFVADVLIGKAKIKSRNLLSQEWVTSWYPIKENILMNNKTQTNNVVVGQVQVSAMFVYDSVKKLRNELQVLQTRHRNLVAEAETQERVSKTIASNIRHPASFGNFAATANIHMNASFNADSQHPASALRIPFPDKARVLTPFGAGVVIAYRSIAKHYTIRLDKSSELSYIQQDYVKEESEDDTAAIRIGSRVSTPYGTGTVTSINNNDRRDSIISVNLPYGVGHLQSSAVSLPTKSIGEMSIGEKVNHATKLTEDGNTCFKSLSYVDAIKSYLSSLTTLQYINQDEATHKQKATILQTMIRCHLNIGACKLKLKAYGDAITACTNAVNILKVIRDNREGNVVLWMKRLGMTTELLFQEWPVKALYRRAQSHDGNKDLKSAKADLNSVLTLVPKHVGARRMLKRIVSQLKEQKVKDKNTWGGIFNKEDSTVVEEKCEKVLPNAVSVNSQSISTTASSEEEEEEDNKTNNTWSSSSSSSTALLVVAGGMAAALTCLVAFTSSRRNR